MPTAFTLRWPGRSQTTAVTIGNGILARAGSLLKPILPGRRILIVSDRTAARWYGGTLERSLSRGGFHVERLEIPAGERAKTVAGAERICRELAKRGFLRDGAVAALGGGVTGDLAGFAASIYMRGIPVVQIPTTLLAQVDSCLGGKTGADLPEGKNLVGTFHQPAAILADPLLLETLPPRIFREGLSETLKYGVLRDAWLLSALERNALDALRNEEELRLKIVERSLANKAAIAALDERDAGQRQLLNFGHTFGHALEAAGRYKRWSHGEAVAIGICVETRLSRRLGILHDKGLPDRLQGTLERLGFPLRVPVKQFETALPRLGLDKKNTERGTTWVLPVKAGHCRIVTGLAPDKLQRHLLEIGREHHG